MNRSAILLLSALFAYLCQSCAQQDERIISNTMAGAFEKHMPMEIALHTAQEKYTVEKSSLFLEGIDYTAYDLMYDGELVMKLEPSYPDASVLWRIWIYSNRYTTSAGSGVGSTVEEVLQHYTFDVLRAEGALTCLFVKEFSICFAIDPGDIPPQRPVNKVMPENLPDEAKISLILL